MRLFRSIRNKKGGIPLGLSVGVDIGDVSAGVCLSLTRFYSFVKIIGSKLPEFHVCGAPSKSHHLL